MKQLEFSMPVRVSSETNSRESWPAKYRRKKAQKKETHVEWKSHARGKKIALPCVVRLTRIGSRRLDDDNLGESFKAIRDQIASEIGVDDGSELIKFEYAQEAIGRRTYSVRVEVYRAGVCAEA
jgi:hypothetical protein